MFIQRTRILPMAQIRKQTKTNAVERRGMIDTYDSLLRQSHLDSQRHRHTPTPAEHTRRPHR